MVSRSRAISRYCVFVKYEHAILAKLQLLTLLPTHHPNHPHRSQDEDHERVLLLKGGRPASYHRWSGDAAINRVQRRGEEAGREEREAYRE